MASPTRWSHPSNRQATPALPIDYFFRSLVMDQKTRAGGVALSGTGADGTLGLKDIKGKRNERRKKKRGFSPESPPLRDADSRRSELGVSLPPLRKGSRSTCSSASISQ